jgi:hypothetical protein
VQVLGFDKKQSSRLRVSLDLKRIGSTSLQVFLIIIFFDLIWAREEAVTTGAHLKAGFKEQSHKLSWHTTRWRKKIRDGSWQSTLDIGELI